MTTARKNHGAIPRDCITLDRTPFAHSAKNLGSSIRDPGSCRGFPGQCMIMSFIRLYVIGKAAAGRPPSTLCYPSCSFSRLWRPAERHRRSRLFCPSPWRGLYCGVCPCRNHLPSAKPPQPTTGGLTPWRGLISSHNLYAKGGTRHAENCNRDRPSRVRSRRGRVNKRFRDAGLSALKERGQHS